MLDSLVSPCMSLVPFSLLPPCWSSKRVSLYKSMCGPFNRNCLVFQKFLSHSLKLFRFLQTEVVETFLPGTGTLGRWAWCDPGTPHSWDIRSYFYPVHMGPAHMGLTCSMPPPIYPSQCGFFFNSIVVRLPFSSISSICEWWLLCSLAAILMWLCKEASCVYLCHHLDWKFLNFLKHDLL